MVFDTSVVVSAVFWPASTARRALAVVARRRAQMAITAATLAEYELTLAEIGPQFPGMNWRGSLAYIRAKAVPVEAAPLGKARWLVASKMAQWRDVAKPPAFLPGRRRSHAT